MLLLPANTYFLRRLLLFLFRVLSPGRLGAAGMRLSLEQLLSTGVMAMEDRVCGAVLAVEPQRQHQQQQRRRSGGGGGRRSPRDRDYRGEEALPRLPSCLIRQKQNSPNRVFSSIRLFMLVSTRERSTLTTRNDKGLLRHLLRRISGSMFSFPVADFFNRKA